MRFDIHVHSCFSDGIPTPKEIVDHCRKIKLDGVAVTDHDCVEGSLEALKYAGKGFTVIPGLEVSAREGHILALGVKKNIEPGLSARETIERIHKLGGIAIAAHPYDRYRRGVGDAILELPFDAVEVANGHTFTNSRSPREMALQAGKPMTGGTDAHSLQEIGNVSIVFNGDPLEAIKKGRVVIESAGAGKLAYSHAKTLLRRLARGAGRRLK